MVDLVTVGLRRPALAGLPMLAIYSVPVAVYLDSVPVLPFVIGAIGFLWLLVADNVDRVRRFGRRFTGDGRDVDVWEPSPLAAAGRRLAVIGVVARRAAAARRARHDRPACSRQIGGGSRPGHRARRRAAAATSTCSRPSPGNCARPRRPRSSGSSTSDTNPFYLRFGVADELTNQGFRGPVAAAGSRCAACQDPRGRPARRASRYEHYRATVEVTDRFEMSLAPIYASRSTSTASAATGLRPEHAGGLLQPTTPPGARNTRSTTSVATTPPRPCAPRQPLAANSVAGDALHPGAGRAAGRPPASTTSPRARAPSTTRSGRSTTTSPAATTSPTACRRRAATSGEDIVDFLESKLGFCQQYAAAMAWMVRAAGIPARVAFGFTAAPAATATRTTLTNRNLHAWTEVYFGRLRLGPVRRDPGRPASPARPGRPGRPTPNAPTRRPRRRAAPSAGPGRDAGAGRRRRRTRSAATTRRRAARPAPLDSGGPTWPMYLLGAAVVLLALLLVPALRRVAAAPPAAVHHDHGRGDGGDRDGATAAPGARDGGGHRRRRRSGPARTRTPPGTS